MILLIKLIYYIFDIFIQAVTKGCVKLWPLNLLLLSIFSQTRPEGAKDSRSFSYSQIGRVCSHSRPKRGFWSRGVTTCLKCLFSTMALYRCEVPKNLMPFQLGLMCRKVHSFISNQARRKSWVNPDS